MKANINPDLSWYVCTFRPRKATDAETAIHKAGFDVYLPRRRVEDRCCARVQVPLRERDGEEGGAEVGGMRFEQCLPGRHASNALTAKSSIGVSPVVRPIHTRSCRPVCC